MEILQQFGFTQVILEGLVVFGVLAAIIAVYWRLIVIGCTGLFILWVIMNHQPTATEAPKVDSYKEFMEDCMSIAANDRSTCLDIWHERDAGKKEMEQLDGNKR